MQHGDMVGLGLVGNYVNMWEDSTKQGLGIIE